MNVEYDPNLLWILPAVIVGWILLTGFISLIGGWFSLSHRFPLIEGVGIVRDRFAWRSINLNYICGYRGCVNITITDFGVILKTIFIFSSLHKPIFFKWNDITNQVYKEGIFRSKKFVFFLGRTRISLYGKAAEAVYSGFLNRNN